VVIVNRSEAAVSPNTVHLKQLCGILF
jgi:hypothetical protein